MPALTFEVAPLQLAPAAVGAWAYWRRARTLRERGHPVPGWRQWCWYGGIVLIAATLISPLAGLSDQLFLAHMIEHLLIADLGALLLVLGLTGPLLQPILAVRRWPGCACSRTRSWRSRCGRRTSTSGTCPRSTRAPSRTTTCTRWSTCCSSPAGWRCGWRSSAAAQARVVRQRREAPLHPGRAADRPVLANALLWSGSVFYPRYAAASGCGT